MRLGSGFLAAPCGLQCLPSLGCGPFAASGLGLLEVLIFGLDMKLVEQLVWPLVGWPEA